MSRTTYIKTIRTLHSFKNISPTLESLINYCSEDGYTSIGLSPTTSIVRKNDFRGVSFELRLLKDNDLVKPDEIIIYYHTIATSNKSDTDLCLEAIEKVSYIQEKYKIKLIELIEEHSINSTINNNTFFKNGKEICLKLINEKIKDIKPIKSNKPNSNDYIGKRLYSYISNNLQLLKVDYKEVEHLISNRTKDNFSLYAIDNEKNTLANRRRFLDLKFLPLLEEVKKLIKYYSSSIESEVEHFKQLHEFKIDDLELECEKDIEELQEQKNNRTQQEVLEEFVEYCTMDGPYESWIEDSMNKKDTAIEELEDDLINEDKFKLAEEIVEINQDKISELYHILGKQLVEGYKIHIYHLMTTNKKYKTSAIKYYQDRNVIPITYIGQEFKLINEAIYTYDLIQNNQHLFKTNIISKQLATEVFISDYQVNVLNIKDITIDSIEKCLTQFQTEINQIEDIYIDMMLFYKYNEDSNFWILLVGYYYDRFLQYNKKMRSFYTIQELASKLFNLYTKLTNGKKLTQTLIKQTLKS